MAKISIVVGVFLAFIGLSFYGAMAWDWTYWPMLLPVLWAAVFALLGLIALALPSLNKHLIHLAMLVAVAGLIWSGLSLPALKELLQNGKVEQSQFVSECGIMFITLVIYMVVGIRSFIFARTSRTSPAQA